MDLTPEAERGAPSRRRFLAGLGLAGAAATSLAACSGAPTAQAPPPVAAAPPPPGPEPAPPPGPAAIGAGQTRVGMILPLSAPGNAGAAAQSMRNSAEMALAEFKNPDIQLLVKDDGGTAAGAQAAAQGALDEGAQVILGPLFASAVPGAAGVARTRNIPVIAFSTDASIAGRGVYLLSFLPETDVERVVDYAKSRSKTAFAALIPENAYGNVVEAAFKQAVARANARLVAVERVPGNPAGAQAAARRIAPSLAGADALFLPGEPESVTLVARTLAEARVDLKRMQLLGTGLWDDGRVYSDANLQGGWFATPESFGFRNFANRYRARYGGEPLRAATLSYDAVALTAALVKTQGPQRFTPEVLTGGSGFGGIDGIFRFRPDGTNERGLSVVRVTNAGPQSVSPAPKSFTGSGT